MPRPRAPEIRAPLGVGAAVNGETICPGPDLDLEKDMLSADWTVRATCGKGRCY